MLGGRGLRNDRRSLTLGAFVLVAVALALPAVAWAALGELTQKAGKAGCVSETGTGGACQDGVALSEPQSIAVSADGKSVYLASSGSAAVVILDRDTTSGALAQKAATARCVSEDGTGAICQDGKALDGAVGVAVSPDGKSVYSGAFGSDAVGIFDRDATGALAQKAGTAGCVSEAGTGGACQDGVALDGASTVAVSPDGVNVYVASVISGAVAVLDRDAAGALAQKPGTAGCVSEDGTGAACQDGAGLAGASGVAVSADGKNVYVASASDALAILDRDTTTGALTQKPGTAGCVSETGTGGACQDGKALDGPFAVAVSADGKSVYVASEVSDAVAIFDRNTTTGALTQKAGTAGCVSETGTAGACQDGIALDAPLGVAVSPDGGSVYAGAVGSDAVTTFDRDTTTGALSQKAGTTGCVSETGTGGACEDGVALDAALDVEVSPDGEGLYVAAFDSDAAAIFDRAGPDPPPPPPPPPPAAFGDRTRVGLKLKAKRIPARGPVKVRVSNGNDFEVTGRLSGRTVRPVSAAGKRPVKLKAKPFEVAADSAGTVKLRLPKSLQRLIKRKGELKLRLKAKVTDPAANTRTVKRRVTPKLKKPKG